MNYLQLAQKVREKCRIIGSGPTAVTNQSAEYTRVLNWVNEAWLEIQRRHEDWRWMRASATAVTVNTQYAYSPTADFNLTDFGNWALDYANGDTFRNYVTSVGPQSEVFMPVIDYDRWRDVYLYGANRYAYSRPIEIALAPDRSLVVGPVPVDGYTLIGDYYKIPTELSAATDEPGMPSQYHWAIVYKAMMFYGISEAAPEVYDEGRMQFDQIIRQLERTQLRRMAFAGALA